MDDAIYDWREVRPRPAPDGGTDLVGSRPGPAGLSAVELPDGTVWAVDHAGPERLVSLEVPGDLLSSPAALAAFGGDGVLFLLDRLKNGGTPQRAGRTGGRNDRTSRRFSSARSSEPAAVGRLLVLADLADDEDLGPLARIAAAVELVVGTDDESIAELLETPAALTLRAAAAGASQVDELDIALLEPVVAHRLADVVDDAVHRGTASAVLTAVDRAGLAGLAGRLARHASAPGIDLDEPVLAAALPPPVMADAAPLLGAAARRMAVPHAPGPGDGSTVEVERLSSTLLEVRAAVPSGWSDPWVRVLDRDGLVPLAQVPLTPSWSTGGPLGVAGRLVVPPEVAEADLRVELCRGEDLDRPTSTSADDPAGSDAVRHAVRLGREAVRADRTGRRRVAVERWAECAQAWAVTGDERRARLAATYGARNRSSSGRRGGPLLADLVVEAHEDW